ncbi:hypothetical protein ACE0DR_01635 [Azotobacter sp. CWF10]
MKIQLTHDELLALLDEQIDFLKASASAFDHGFAGEIKRLALAVRVLVHDAAKSTSLLQLTQKKGTKFLDTSFPFDEANKLSHSSLVQLRMDGRRIYPEPFLDGGPFNRMIEFENWWNGIVFVDKNRHEFSRKDIVLTLANKEGGAHVDPELDARYADLRKNNSLGWIDVANDGNETPGEDQVPAAMRQIAHETIKTLDPSYQVEDVYSKRGGIITLGATLVEGSMPPSIPANNLVKNRPQTGGKR